MERLGLRPFLLVQWKQMCRDTGFVEITVQDWSEGDEDRALGFQVITGVKWPHARPA